MKSRGELWMVLGVALSAWLFGFTVSPAPALSTTETDRAKDSPGTTGPITGLLAGHVGPISSSLGGGFPNVTGAATLGTGVTADGVGPRVDNNAGLTLTFLSNFFGQGLATDSAKYLAGLWTDAPEPTTLLLFGATLVGLGSLLRRRMRGAAKTTV